MVRAEVCSGGYAPWGANRQVCTSMVSCTSHLGLKVTGIKRLGYSWCADLLELQSTRYLVYTYLFSRAKQRTCISR
jgi:hypothetical protein